MFGGVLEWMRIMADRPEVGDDVRPFKLYMRNTPAILSMIGIDQRKYP